MVGPLRRPEDGPIALAEKVLDIFWPQSVPFHLDRFPEPTVLTQNRGAPDTHVAILREITEFRREEAPDPSAPLPRARRAAPEAYEKLIGSVEWKLIQMPLPRVQRFGRTHLEFLYCIGWDMDVRVGRVSAYQRGESSLFDNRIHLQPGVGEHLVLQNGLLRSLIHRQWAAMVAQMNELDESRLEDFLFGTLRILLDPVRSGLPELQKDRCFYCEDQLTSSGRRRPEVDHFIPWARYPNNAIENLVVAQERCKNRKRDSLAAPQHLDRWRDRVEDERPVALELVTVAEEARWETAPQRSLSVTRAIYLRLPPNAKLWRRGREFVDAEPERLQAALG